MRRPFSKLPHRRRAGLSRYGGHLGADPFNRADGHRREADPVEVRQGAILEIRDACRIHGRGEAAVHALRGVTLSVGAGELVAVMGPSGSGKSTLLNLAGGLDRPTRGAVVVDGVVLGGCSMRALAALRRRRIGYVFQDLNLLPSLTAAENVALPLELDGMGVRRSRALALATLADVDLDGFGSRFPDEMSGGQQQRVAIARAVVGQRRLVLADEPTGALDSSTGEAVLRLLRSKVDDGAAGVLVTHEARHATWADRVVVLRDGLVVDEPDPDEPDPDEPDPDEPGPDEPGPEEPNLLSAPSGSAP